MNSIDELIDKVSSALDNRSDFDSFVILAIYNFPTLNNLQIKEILRTSYGVLVSEQSITEVREAIKAVEVRELFYTLWTKAVDSPDYNRDVKKLWQRFEIILRQEGLLS